MSQFDSEYLISLGRDVCQSEASSILGVADRLGESFAGAARAILTCKGKVITTGLGKSGYIARKMASTLSSTGSSAIFLHAAEALHGDFGMFQENDCLVAIAYGGETRETLGVASFAKKLEIPVIAITGKLDSPLAGLADHLIDGSIEKEADGLGLAPTASSTVALALCDALSVCVMSGRGFTARDFAALHPGGSLGQRLALVRGHYISGDQLASVREDAGFQEVVKAITKPNHGIIAVLDASNRLVGAISDGDLRRALLGSGERAFGLRAKDIMGSNPKTIEASEAVYSAVSRMEENQIISLFVTEEGKYAGIVRLHDLIAAKMI